MVLPARDSELIQIVDAALEEAVRKGGEWIACRKGCTECCMGPFPISQLDAMRLRRGLAGLEEREPERAARVRARARDYVARLGGGATVAREIENLPSWADDEPCPALDPATGTCDLYHARPLTCRTFGPAIRCGDGDIGVCELCFEGASDEEIAACTVEIDTGALEDAVLAEIEAAGETSDPFIVASCLT